MLIRKHEPDTAHFINDRILEQRREARTELPVDDADLDSYEMDRLQGHEPPTVNTMPAALVAFETAEERRQVIYNRIMQPEVFQFEDTQGTSASAEKSREICN